MQTRKKNPLNKRPHKVARKRQATASPPGDINDRMLILHDNEARLEDMFNATTDAIITIDENHRIVNFNPAAEFMYRCQARDVIGQSLNRFIPEHIRADHAKWVKAYGETGTSHRTMKTPALALTCLRADGDAFPAEASISRIQIRGQKYFTALVRDITERQRAEAALEIERRDNQAIIDAAPVMIAYKNLDDRFVKVNHAFAEFVGFPRDQIIGKTTFDIVQQPHVAARGREHDLEVIRTGKAITNQLVKWSGFHSQKEIWALYSKYPFYDPHGKIIGTVSFVVDVNDRILMEEAMRLQSAITRNLSEGISLVRAADNVIVYCNSVLEQMFGYAPGELVGKHVSILNAPDGASPADKAAEIQAKIETDKRWSGELHNIRKDGTRFWTYASISQFDHAEHGSVHVALRQDITERKRTENNLIESERRYRALFENIPAGCVLFEVVQDEKGVPVDLIILAANAGFEKTTGLKTQAVTGKRLTRVLPGIENDAADWIGTYGKIALTAKSQQFEQSSELLGYYYSVTAYQSAPKQCAVTFLDITERKRAAEALRDSEERYRLLAEAAHDNIFVVNRDGAIEYVNQFAAALFNYPPEELVGQKMTAFFPPEIGQRQFASIQTVFQTRAPLYTENKSVFPHGEVWLGTWLSPLFDASAQVRAVMGIARDITDRKQAEQAALYRLVELEAVNRVSTALRVAQTLDQMLPVLLDQTLAVLHTDTGIIRLDNHHRHASVARGWCQEIHAPSLESNAGIAGRVLSTGQLYHAREFASDPQLGAPERGQTPAGWGGACLPIHTTEGIIGVMLIAVPLPRELNADELNLLATLAEIAGNAIHRTHLHNRTVRQVERLAALHTIDASISHNFDLRFTLDILLEHTLSQLHVDAAAVLLFNPYLKTLEFSAGRGFRGAGILHLALALGEDYAGKAALEHRLVTIPNLKATPLAFTQPHLTAGEDFVAYYGVPLIAKGQLKGVLEIFHRAPLAPDQEWLDFMETLAGQAAIIIDNTRLFEDLQRSNLDLELAYDATIEGWSRALDLRDKETEGHTKRVVDLSIKLARAMGMSASELMHVRRGALLHDIGKMGVPDSILLKPASLDEKEWEIMRRHPRYAYEMLSPITFLRAALDIPYGHHEKWDGSGYPQGLQGEQISLAARIFAVVDVWDALSSDRPYRTAWDGVRVEEYIRSQAGTYFDPKVVDTFLKLIYR